jgi:hypothetical protein
MITCSTSGVFQAPPNHNIVGTCGECGGPIISPMFISGTAQLDEHCAGCGRRAKRVVTIPAYGPIREMEK